MRNAYLLSLDHNSERAVESKGMLEKVSFDVIQSEVVPNDSGILSNRLSMVNILKNIISSKKRWSYIFEDDIQFWEYFALKSLTSFEKKSKSIFYLGACSLDSPVKTKEIIDSRPVYRFKSENTRCCHGLAISLSGAKHLLKEQEKFDDSTYFDEIVGKTFASEEPLILRGDLVSFLDPTHYGLVFQDRDRYSPNNAPAGGWGSTQRANRRRAKVNFIEKF